MTRETFALHVKRSGILRTAFAYTVRMFRRIVDFDLMLVESAVGAATDSTVVEPYVTRQISEDEFRQEIQWLGEGHDRPGAFDHDGRCFGNFLDSRLVGYQFYANRITMIRPGLAFGIPDALTYAYGSFTHPDHRGRRLAKSRANARRLSDRAQGIEREVVWYVSVGNLSSRAANRRIQLNLIGYVGYIKIGGRFYCYASPGCKRTGLTLIPTEA